MQILTWIRLNLRLLYNEIFGEPVDHPFIARGLAFAVDYVAFTFYGIAIHWVFDTPDFFTNAILLLSDTVILTVYLTLAGSKMFHGQTLGKLIFRIRVMDERGNHLRLRNCFLRALFTALVINGFQILVFFGQEGFTNVLLAGYSVLVMIVFGILYFSIFTINRQGLHDIIAGSQVIPKNRSLATTHPASLIKVIGYLLIIAGYLVYAMSPMMR